MGHLRLRVHRGPPFFLRAKKGCCQRHRRPTRWAGWRRSNQLQYKWAACTETCSTRAHGPLDRIGPRLQRERRRTGAARTRWHRRTALQRLGADVQPRASLRNGTGRAGMRAGCERGTVCGARPTFRSKQRHRAAPPDRRSRSRLHPARRAEPPAPVGARHGDRTAARNHRLESRTAGAAGRPSAHGPARLGRLRRHRRAASRRRARQLRCDPARHRQRPRFGHAGRQRLALPARDPAADPPSAPPRRHPCRLVRRPVPTLRAQPARCRFPVARPRRPGARRPGRSAAHDLPGLGPAA